MALLLWIPARCLAAGAGMTSPVTAAPERGRHAMHSAEGAVISGRFQLKERLGRGSVAEVFRAVDLAGGPDVAVKVEVANSDKQHERIRHEAEVLAALHHPSIIRFVAQGVMPDGDPGSGSPFLVQELALGTSLSEAARSNSHRPGEVAVWARELFSALAHLHSQGLVHRDIKPANLMLSGLRRSPVRIIDFGITAAAGSAPEPGISSGTAHYMSPEQASGGVTDPSWDVYSLGLVLLEFLTGEKAFPGTAIESLVARTLRTPHVPDLLGPRWTTFLKSLTAMDSRQRPTAEEAAAVAARLVPPAPAVKSASACRVMAGLGNRRNRQWA
jgi:serine/threonine protein kinase